MLTGLVLGLEVNEPTISPELLSLLSADGANIAEILFKRMAGVGNTGKKHTASLRETSSCARQMLFIRTYGSQR